MRLFINALIYSALALLLFGVLLQSSDNAWLLGKYNKLDVLFIAVLLLLGYGWRVVENFNSKTAVVTLSTGKIISFSPQRKWRLVLMLLVLLLILLELTLSLINKNTLSSQQGFHPFLQNILYPDVDFHVNKAGFRGEEITLEKPDNSFRIFVVGGSTVLSRRMRYQKSHVRLLEQQLQQRYPDRDVQVFNAGNDWHTTQHSIIKYLFKIKDYNPDLIILWHGINDLCRSFTPMDYSYGTYRNDYSHFYGPIARLVANYFNAMPSFVGNLQTVSYFVKSIAYLDRKLYRDLRSDPDGPNYGQASAQNNITTFASLPAFKRNMQSLIDILATDKVDLILATQPSIFRAGLTAKQRASIWFNTSFCRNEDLQPSLASMADGMQQFNQATRTIAQNNQIKLIELADSIAKDDVNFLDDCHYTEYGNQQVANSIEDFIVRYDVLQ